MYDTNYSNDSAKWASQQEAKQPIFNETIDALGYYRLDNNLIRYFDALGLTESQFLFLNLLMSAERKERPKTVYFRMGVIAERTGLSYGAIRKISAELEKAGFIKRTRKNSGSLYTYTFEGIGERLAACIEKDGSKQHSGYTIMPTAFTRNFGHIRNKYGLAPRHFVLMAYFLMYRQAEARPLSYNGIGAVLGWSWSKVKQAFYALREAGFIQADLDHRSQKYIFDTTPFTHTLSWDIMTDEIISAKEEKANDEGRSTSNGGVGQPVTGGVGQSVAEGRSISSGLIKKKESIKKGEYKKALKEKGSNAEKSAPVMIDRSAKKANPENHPGPQEQTHQETTATVSANQESTDQEYQKWREERAKKAEQEKEERIEQRIKTFIADFFTNENLDASIIRPAIERDPISRAAYDRLIAMDRVPPRFRFRDDRQVAREVMSAV